MGTKFLIWIQAQVVLLFLLLCVIVYRLFFSSPVYSPRPGDLTGTGSAELRDSYFLRSESRYDGYDYSRGGESISRNPGRYAGCGEFGCISGFRLRNDSWRWRD